MLLKDVKRGDKALDARLARASNSSRHISTCN